MPHHDDGRSIRYDDSMSDENDKKPSFPVRVLLVDNDKDHARAMNESLERIGLETTFATSGPEGAKLLDENTYEIVVTRLDDERHRRYGDS